MSFEGGGRRSRRRRRRRNFSCVRGAAAQKDRFGFAEICGYFSLKPKWNTRKHDISKDFLGMHICQVETGDKLEKNVVRQI